MHTSNIKALPIWTRTAQMSYPLTLPRPHLHADESAFCTPVRTWLYHSVYSNLPNTRTAMIKHWTQARSRGVAYLRCWGAQPSPNFEGIVVHIGALQQLLPLSSMIDLGQHRIPVI